jgi:hypothetical protein
MGYVRQWKDGGSTQFEADTTRCRHCPRVLFIHRVPDGVKGSVFASEGGFCMKCNGPLCGPCAKKLLTGVCESYKKKIDLALDAMRLRASIGG